MNNSTRIECQHCKKLVPYHKTSCINIRCNAGIDMLGNDYYVCDECRHSIEEIIRSTPMSASKTKENIYNSSDKIYAYRSLDNDLEGLYLIFQEIEEGYDFYFFNIKYNDDTGIYFEIIEDGILDVDTNKLNDPEYIVAELLEYCNMSPKRMVKMDDYGKYNLYNELKTSNTVVNKSGEKRNE